MNPVFIREMRQMVRNKFVATALIVYLFALLATVMLTIMAKASSGGLVSLAGKGAGQYVSIAVLLVLGLLTTIVVPLFTGIRMSLEKSPESMDLQFATTLRPAQFVDGKIGSSFVLLLLFASATLPFLMLAYILRGADVFTMLVSIGSTLLYALLMLYVAVFIGSLNLNKAFRIIIMIIMPLFALQMFAGVGMMLIIARGLGGGGPTFMSMSMSSTHQWWAVALILAGFATLCLMLRAAAAAHLAPPHVNGQRPLRVTVAIAWAAWGALALIVSLIKSELYIMAWYFTFGSILLLMLFGAVSSQPGYSRRVLSEIKPRWRGLQFLMFTGAESGIAFALVLIFITMLGGFGVTAVIPSPSYNDDVMEKFAMFFCYPAAHFLTARLIWQAGLRRVMNCKYVGLAGLVWMFAGSIFTAVIFARSSSSDAFTVFSCIWFFIAAILNMPFIFSAANRFRSPAANGKLKVES